MQDLKLLSFEDLLDILLEQTEYHTQLIAKGCIDEQLNTSRTFLRQLQEEIIERKNKKLSSKPAAGELAE